MSTVLEDGAHRFFTAIEHADRHAALRVVDDLLSAGMNPAAVLQDVVCAAQLEVGRRWQAGTWTVAREHAATAISEAAVTAVGLRGASSSPAVPRGHVLVACVDQEWHDLPARVVAEVLAIAGWRTTYLGASTPPDQLTSYLQETVPDVVAVSCSLATGLPRVRRMIDSVHAAGVPVLVGGPAFGADDRLAVRLGADAWAPSAESAVELLASLPADGVGSSGAYPGVRLEHPGLDEHADLMVRRDDLVAAAYDGLATRFAALQSYSAWQVARTREDLGHILDFLGAALFVDDPAIFSRFTGWLQAVLVARGVDERALRLSYEALLDALDEATPRARQLLRQAAASLPGS